MTELNARIRDIPIPTRMQKLPISAKGFPVPFFVSWLDQHGRHCRRGEGTPDFRVITRHTVLDCHRNKRCWLCGEPLGSFKAFLIGPMCAINRVSSEPPSHLDCARYAVQACPFLAQPRMRRNNDGLPGDGFKNPGFLDRNPGATLLWVTKGYRLARNGESHLFHVDEPVAIEWYREGRTATRAEVLESIESGLPLLRAEAEAGGPQDVALLERMIPPAMALVPAA